MKELRRWEGPRPIPKTPPPPPRVAPWRRALRVLRRGWIGFGHVLGWVNSRILLGVFFFVLFTPVRIVLALMRRDPMARRRSAAAATYWLERDDKERRRPPEDYGQTF